MPPRRCRQAHAIPALLAGSDVLGSAATGTGKDLVGAITNEANISGDAIGAIEIGPQRSLVEVLEVEADKVIRALSRATIRGQRVTARRERGG